MSSIPQSPIDIETIIERRKRQWIASTKKTISVQERIATSVPWWLIIIATGLFALSASHTAGVFNQLSNIGYAGPFVVEFALLWAAFVRASAKQGSTGVSRALHGLEILVFIMAVGANTIGSMSRLAMLSGIDTFSFSKILSQFGALPVTTQAEMLFVPLFGLFIPVGTWVVGEGLADLFLKQRQTGGLLEEKWREVERAELYKAFFSELVGRGMVATLARQRAESLSAGVTHTQQKLLPSGETSIRIETQKSIQRPVQLNRRSERLVNRPEMGPTARVIEYLNANPDAAKTMSQNQIARELKVSNGTVNAVFKNLPNEHSEKQS